MYRKLAKGSTIAIFAAFLLVGIANAHPHEETKRTLEFTGGYDYYITPNEGNNYDDAQGFNVGIIHPITKSLEGSVLFKHITDIHFPVADDPKGSFGELRGYSGNYDIRFKLPISTSLRVYLYAGVGYWWWDFKENPFLQDNQVTVEVDSSFSYEGGVGAIYQVNDDWMIQGNIGWFDTDVPKDARDQSGREWHILDDNEIGLQYIQVGLQARYRF